MGLIEASINLGPDDWPDEIKENFVDKVDTLVDNLHSELLEFVRFGEALDNAGED